MAERTASRKRPDISVTFTTQCPREGSDGLISLLDAVARLPVFRLWVNEFHSGDPPYLPAIPFLAFIAGRHPDLPLGTAVTVPNLHHPLRLAEEINFLSMLTEFALGVGLGYSVDYRRFGLSPPVLREFEGSVDSLRKHLEGIALTTPRPIPFYLGSASPKALVELGGVVDGLLLHPSQPVPHLVDQIAVFRKASEGRNVRVCMMRDAVMSGVPEHAEKLADTAILEKYRYYVKLGREVVGDDLRPLSANEVSLATMADRVIVGNAESAMAQLEGFLQLDIDELSLRVSYPDWSVTDGLAAVDELATILRTVWPDS